MEVLGHYAWTFVTLVRTRMFQAAVCGMVLMLSAAIAVGQDPETDASGGAAEAGAFDGSAEAPIHDQLRELRSNLEAVVASGKWDDLVPYLSTQVIVTWLDGTQSHGIEEVLQYLRDKTEGDDAIVDQFQVTTEVADLSDLYGDSTAIAFGSATSRFVLRGRELTMEGPWSATVVLEDGQWKLASLASSLGAFDNPLFAWFRRMLWVVGIVAGIVGLILGVVIGRKGQKSAA